MSDKRVYLAFQLILLLLPATLATCFLSTNDYISNNYSEYLIYIAGVTGFISVVLLSESLSILLPESLASFISIGLYILIATLIFVRVYQPVLKRFFIVSSINVWLAIWSVFIGDIFLFLAMQ
ncbi:hypothetical protein [Glaciecola sp. MF2-115]|uniref:hypothetical protein n=1 Tax=Glaciecola sp. MF2-115 TaxID=3384827 RepID=UPI0039A24763